jgi:WD40 repeat protein
MAAGLTDGTVVVWNGDGTKSFELKQHSGTVSSISWNGMEGKSHLFVIGSYDQVKNLKIERISADHSTSGEMTSCVSLTTEGYRLGHGRADCAPHFPFSLSRNYGNNVDLF